MAGIVLAPTANVKGLAELIKQVHDKYITIVNKTSLNDIALLAKLITGEIDDAKAITEVCRKHLNFLQQFYYTFAIAIRDDDIIEVYTTFPCNIVVSRVPECPDQCVVLLTTHLAGWINTFEHIQIRHKLYHEAMSIKKIFESMGLGRFFT